MNTRKIRFKKIALLRLLMTLGLTVAGTLVACAQGSSNTTPASPATAAPTAPASNNQTIPVSVEPVTVMPSSPELSVETHKLKDCPRGITNRAWASRNEMKRNWDRSSYRVDGQKLIETFENEPVVYDGEIHEYTRHRSQFPANMKFWYVAYCRDRQLITKVWGTDGARIVKFSQTGRLRDGILETRFEGGEPTAWLEAY